MFFANVIPFPQYQVSVLCADIMKSFMNIRQLKEDIEKSDDTAMPG